MKSKIKLLLTGLLLFWGCSTLQEVVMPFRNIAYLSDTIFPIQNSDQEWTFRAWISNGTSIDRIITVTKDSLFGYESSLIELGTLHKDSRAKSKKIYNVFLDFTPKSGYDEFFKAINSLGLENYNTQDDFSFHLDHQPMSLYTIELKYRYQYHQFSFRTYFPISKIDTTRQVDKKYEIIEKLLFDEFKYEFYMK